MCWPQWLTSKMREVVVVAAAMVARQTGVAVLARGMLAQRMFTRVVRVQILVGKAIKSATCWDNPRWRRLQRLEWR